MFFSFFILLFDSAAEGAETELRPGDDLQLAVDNANLGDSLFLRAGTYEQSITINTSLYVRGEGGTIIRGGDTGILVAVNADNVTLSLLEIVGGHTGIHVSGSSDIRIENVSFSGQTSIGLHIEHSRNVLGEDLHLSGINATVSSYGIKTYNCSGIELERTTMMGNTYGAFLSTTNFIIIRNSTFSRSVRSGVYLTESQLMLSDSQFQGNDIGLRTVNSAFVAMGSSFQNNSRYGAFIELSAGNFHDCSFTRNLYALRVREADLRIRTSDFKDNDFNLDVDEVSTIIQTDNSFIGGEKSTERGIPNYVYIILIMCIFAGLKYRLPDRKWEMIVEKLLLIAGVSSIFFILLIFFFLMREGLHIFEFVSLGEFLFGKTWNPSFDRQPEYGILALVVSTFLVTAGAVVIAVPIGVGAAVYLAEFASPRVKEFIKPAIELLVGIPSVVYGFFALVILSGWVFDLFGATTRLNALLGSIMLAVMMIPIIVSLSEDALRSVPQELREASFALGASQWDTSRRVMIPAALSGIIGAIILGIARAVGETMTVLMATGNSPAFTFNMLQSVRTMTATIAIEMGEVAIPSEHYYALFGIGIVLFIITFIINLTADIILNRFRERYV